MPTLKGSNNNSPVLAKHNAGLLFQQDLFFAKFFNKMTFKEVKLNLNVYFVNAAS